MSLAPTVLMDKAIRASRSARVLLDEGDVDGACNRAYYAMFDAARAALLQSGAPVAPDIGRTHSGVLTAFGLYLVKEGPLPVELGRSLSRAQEVRLVADYKGDSVDADDANDVVIRAAEFVASVQQMYFSVAPVAAPTVQPKQ
jgi:uncharacterized protein (UPF0332 family)